MLSFDGGPYPEPLVEIPPNLAAKAGVRSGDMVRVASRSRWVTRECQVVKTIRPDTILIPYPGAGERSANRLKIRTLGPAFRIPQYKVFAVKIERAR